MLKYLKFTSWFYYIFFYLTVKVLKLSILLHAKVMSLFSLPNCGKKKSRKSRKQKHARTKYVTEFFSVHNKLSCRAKRWVLIKT